MRERERELEDRWMAEDESIVGERSRERRCRKKEAEYKRRSLLNGVAREARLRMKTTRVSTGCRGNSW